MCIHIHIYLYTYIPIYIHTHIVIFISIYPPTPTGVVENHMVPSTRGTPRTPGNPTYKGGINYINIHIFICMYTGTV